MSGGLEVARPEGEVQRAQASRSNWRQVILFAILTLSLSVATVWSGRTLLRDSETLTFVVGSAGSEEAQFAGITRIAPEKAGQLATAILMVGEKIEHAHSLDALEQLEDELEKILRGAVIGLRDGTTSSDGLDTFKLGYEFVRDELAMRRDHLERHARDAAPAPGDNAAVVKAARSV